MGNRVTNAALMTKLEAVDERLEDLCGQVDKMNGRQRDDHDEITRLKEQMSTTSKAQTAFTSIAAVIAALVGVSINR